MNDNVRCPAIWSVLLCFAGCFHVAADLDAAAELPRATGLTVKDASFAVWPAASAPRRPHFELRLEHALPTLRTPNPPLYWVVGQASDEIVDDLLHPPLRAATLQVVRPLVTRHEGSTVYADLGAESLPPAQRYSLIWAVGEGQVFPIEISSRPEAGAAFIESFPARDARDVPPNAQQALLRFDGHLAQVPSAVLHAGDGTSVALDLRLEPCADFGFAAGDCVWIAWKTPLHPNQAYTLSLGDELFDLTLSPLPAVSLRFETASTPDATAPTTRSTACAKDEQLVQGACVLSTDSSLHVRLLASKPVRAELLHLPKRAAALAFSDPVSLSLLELDAHHCSLLRLTDLAGQITDAPICVPLSIGLASLAIVEVLVDPIGPEPAQEFVELLNFGASPVSLHRFTLTQDAFADGQELSLDAPMAPGERVIVVGPGFDRHNTQDGVVADSVRIVRLDRPLSLANDGATLLLRDAQGRRVSASPRVKPERQGQALVRRPMASARSGLAADFLLDPDEVSTPGKPTLSLGEAPP